MTAERSVVVKVSAEVSQYKRDMDAAAASTKKLSQANQDVGKSAQSGNAAAKSALKDYNAQVDAAAKRTSTLKDTLGKGLALGAGAFGGAALVSGIKDSIQAASDLQQSIGKTNDIFGQNAAQVQAWSKTSATAFGLSQQAALEAASTFGDMFTQLGFAGPKAADLSTQVVQLAGDLGAFNNLPTADVLDRIGGAFRGEYDALQKVIPNISAARVQTEAMAETGKKNADSLTAQEKATAVLAIVQRDGAKAAGNFAKTSGDAATKQQIAAAKMQDTKAAIGNSLLPVYQSLLDVFQSSLPVIEAIGVGIGHLASFVNGIPGPLKAAAAAMLAFKLVAKADWFASLRTNMAGFSSAVKQVRIDADDAGKYMSKLGATSKLAGEKLGGIGKAVAGGAAFVGLGLVVDALGTAFENAKPKVTDFSAAVDANTGALTENAAAATAAALAQSGAFDVVGRLGVSADTYTNALLGSADAQKALNDQLAAGGKSAIDKGDVDDIYNFARAIDQASEDQKNLTDAQRHGQQVAEAANGTLRTAGEDHREAAAAARTSASAQKAATDAANALGDANSRAHEAAAQAARDAGQGATAIAAHTAANLEYQRVIAANAAANEADAAAVEKAQGAYDRAAAALSPYAQAAQDAADAQSALATATQEVLTQIDKIAGRVPTAEQAISDMHAATDALATSAGVGSKDFEAYSTSIVKASGEISTASETGRQYRDDTLKARDAIVAAGEAEYARVASTKGAKAAQEAANKVVQQGVKDWEANSTAAFGGGEAGAAASKKVQKAYGLIPKVISTQIKADDDDHKKKAAEVEAKQKALDGAKATVLIDADDPAQAKADAVDRDVAALNGKSATVILNVTDYASSTIANVQSMLVNLPRQVSTVVTVSKQGAVAGGGLILSNGLPGFARGGVLPGQTPADRTKDNMLAVGPAGPIKVQSGEYIVNSLATSRNLAALRFINAGGQVPGFAAGGVPSFNFAGRSAPSYGERQGNVVGAFGDLVSWIKDLGGAARDAAGAAQEAAKADIDAKNARWRAIDAQKAENAERLRGAKAGAERARVERQNAAELAKVTREQDKKVAATKRERDATSRAAKAASAKADAESDMYRATSRTRSVLSQAAKAVDVYRDRIAAANDKLAGLRADRAQLKSSVAGSIAGYGGGFLGFSEQRNTPASFINGLKYNLGKIQGEGNNLASLKAKGLSASLLSQIAGGGEDGARVAASLAGATKAQIAQVNKYSALINASASKSGELVAGAVFDKSIHVVQGQISSLTRTSRVLVDTVNAMARALSQGFQFKMNEQGVATLALKGFRDLKKHGVAVTW